jgi:hypothetical protein
MLLWLEEAAVEAAMILAVAVGATLFVLATWSLLADWLGREKSGVDTETAEPSGEAGSLGNPSGRAA